MLSRVELFKTVVCNFEGVPTIGQPFPDEIFRVFANTHPAIETAEAISGNSVRSTSRLLLRMISHPCRWDRWTRNQSARMFNQLVTFSSRLT